MKLNPKQEQFCLEYSSSGNATASYQKVYGVTDETVSASCASKLLKNAKIQARLRIAGTFDASHQAGSKRRTNSSEWRARPKASRDS